VVRSPTMAGCNRETWVQASHGPGCLLRVALYRNERGDDARRCLAMGDCTDYRTHDRGPLVDSVGPDGGEEAEVVVDPASGPTRIAAALEPGCNGLP
jgi:hypothetical protein